MCTIMCVLLEGVDRLTLVATVMEKGRGIRKNVKVSISKNKNTICSLEQTWAKSNI